MARKVVADEWLIVGDATLLPDNKFTGTDGTPLLVRSVNSIYDNYDVGDEIEIPKKYIAYYDKTEGAFIIANVKSKEGKTRKVRFYPNSLAKCIIPIDKNGRRMDKVKTSGHVASWYISQKSIDNAMKKLAGKSIVVKSKSCYTIKDYYTKEYCTDFVYTFVWKENIDLQELSDSGGIKSWTFHKMYLTALSHFNEELKVLQRAYIESHCSYHKGDIVLIRRHYEHEVFCIAITSIFLDGETLEENTYKKPRIIIEGERVDDDGYTLSFFTHYNSPISVRCNVSDIIEKKAIRCKGFR